MRWDSMFAAVRASGTVAAVSLGAMGALADEPQVDQQSAVADTSTPATRTQAAPALSVDGKPWKFMIAPYLWVPAQHGTIASRGVTANVSMNVGQSWDALIDNFKFAACLHMEANKDKWTVFGDIMYTNLGNEVKQSNIDVDQKMGIFEIGGSYAVFDNKLPGAEDDSKVRLRIEPLAGVRVWYLNVNISDSVRSVGPNEAWVDGFAGARCELAFNDAFSLSARADIGTGMSDLTWNILTMANYNFNRNFALFAGWRWLSDDYKKGSGPDRFEYDIQFSGPFVGLKIMF